MADFFQTLAEAPQDVVAATAERLEKRARDPAQIAIVESYIADIVMPESARVFEPGCGTGVVCRRFAEIAAVSEVHGSDPAPGLIACAKELAEGDSKLNFVVGSGEAVEHDDATFDVVVLQTLLSHVPDPEAIVGEARRVLKPGGWLAVCDADFSKLSVAITQGDPLQAVAEFWVSENAANPWLVPSLNGLLNASGFEIHAFRGHNRVDIGGISTGPGWVERGARSMARQGLIGRDLAEAVIAEVERRVKAGRFYAALPFVTVVSTKR